MSKNVGAEKFWFQKANEFLWERRLIDNNVSLAFFLFSSAFPSFFFFFFLFDLRRVVPVVQPRCILNAAVFFATFRTLNHSKILKYRHAKLRVTSGAESAGFMWKEIYVERRKTSINPQSHRQYVHVRTKVWSTLCSSAK